MLTFFKINFSKNSFINTMRVSNCLDPDRNGHSVGPDLSLNCLQRLLADELAMKEFIKHFFELVGMAQKNNLTKKF